MRLLPTLIAALSGTECVLASPVVLSPRIPSAIKRRERQRLSTPKVTADIPVADAVNLVVGKVGKLAHTAGNGGNSTSTGSTSPGSDSSDSSSSTDDDKSKDTEDTSHTKYSANWSGAIIYGTEFKTVTGTLSVPQPHIPSGGSSDTFYGASAWVGFDGDSNCPGTILQVGIDFNIQNGTVSYDTWFEWYPDYAYNFVGFPLHAGDVVTLTAQAINTTSGTVIIENKTTNQNVMHTFVGEEQPLCQSTAEWIVEDYSVGGQLVEMCDWGRATFTNCAATQASGSTASLSNATIYDITANGKIMTDCSTSGSSIVTCEYTG
ncbi:hypothetical protein SBRCBS47491_003409 [Sporothrix bragantina]|uniref:Aspergillopepsin n=1 Tax=Sporothrix bragantina TaxID=671064 RepID=A0ABP0BG94_9PEZI